MRQPLPRRMFRPKDLNCHTVHCAKLSLVIPFNIHFLDTSSCITSCFVSFVILFNIHCLAVWCALLYRFCSCSSYGNKLAQWCVVTDRRLGGALQPPLFDLPESRIKYIHSYLLSSSLTQWSIDKVVIAT